jgi:hypothetical protein
MPQEGMHRNIQVMQGFIGGHRTRKEGWLLLLQHRTLAETLGFLVMF